MIFNTKISLPLTTCTNTLFNYKKPSSDWLIDWLIDIQYSVVKIVCCVQLNCAAVPTAVLNSQTFKTLSKTKMSAAVAAAMNYITKRGDELRHKIFTVSV